MTGHHSDERFDRAMRELHRGALAHLGTDTRRRLRDARSKAGAPSPARRFGWPIASACAALFAVAIAWPLRSPPPADPSQRPAATRTVAGMDHASPAPPPAPAAAAEIPLALAALEESPDFYLWLASNDAAADLLEQGR